MSGPVIATRAEASDTSDVPRSPAGPDARISLRAGEWRHAFVDGAWWPRSRDLRAELPALLAVLEPHAGRVERVAFDIGGWEATGRRPLLTRGVRVRLEGFRSLEPSTVWFVVTGRGPRVGLVVVPPDTSPRVAATILERAGAAESRYRAADLLVDLVPTT